MALEFDDRKYHSIFTKMYYGLFKMGYISNNYFIRFKLIFIIFTIAEIIVWLFLITTTGDDYNNHELSLKNNVFRNTKIENLSITYKNYDSEMSFFVNFLMLLYHVDYNILLIIQLIVLVLILIKVIEICYLIFFNQQVSVPTAKEKIYYTICGTIDCFIKNCGELILIIISLIPFTCKTYTEEQKKTILDFVSSITSSNGLNINHFSNLNLIGIQDKYSMQLNLTCFNGKHYVLLAISIIIMVFTFFNFIYNLFLYNSIDLISYSNNHNNYGLTDYFNNEILWFFIKCFLVCLNIFVPFSNSELVKLSTLLGVLILKMYLLFKKMIKPNNLVQNIYLMKYLFIIVFTSFTLFYSQIGNKISVAIFIMMTLISIISSFAVLNFMFSIKFSDLYVKVRFYIFKGEEISFYNINQLIFLASGYEKNITDKIVVDGFINSYIIEHMLNDEHMNELFKIVNNNSIPFKKDKNYFKSLKQLLNNIKYSISEENMIINSKFNIEVSGN